MDRGRAEEGALHRGGPGRRRSWGCLIDVGATKVTLSDYAPGVPGAFRIRATPDGTLSAPSGVASIYPSSTTLRVVEGGEARKAA